MTTLLIDSLGTTDALEDPKITRAAIVESGWGAGVHVLPASRILAEGNVLFVFPEGTRSADGALQSARDGVAVLALRSGAPIVPIGIAGSNGVWPRGQTLPHPGGRVTVRVGRPFRLADELPPGTDRRTAKGLATGIIMRRIAELLPPRQQGVYGTSPETADPQDGPLAKGG